MGTRVIAVAAVLVAGTAKVTMTGATYDISGTADGFKTDNPSFRTGGTFAINVSC